MLGFDTVRAIAAATAAGITGDSGTLPDGFWSHAASCAVACSLRLAPAVDPGPGGIQPRPAPRHRRRPAAPQPRAATGRGAAGDRRRRPRRPRAAAVGHRPRHRRRPGARRRGGSRRSSPGPSPPTTARWPRPAPPGRVLIAGEALAACAEGDATAGGRGRGPQRRQPRRRCRPRPVRESADRVRRPRRLARQPLAEASPNSSLVSRARSSVLAGHLRSRLRRLSVPAPGPGDRRGPTWTDVDRRGRVRTAVAGIECALVAVKLTRASPRGPHLRPRMHTGSADPRQGRRQLCGRGAGRLYQGATPPRRTWLRPSGRTASTPAPSRRSATGAGRVRRPGQLTRQPLPDSPNSSLVSRAPGALKPRRGRGLVECARWQYPARQGSLRDSASLRVLARPFRPSLDPPRLVTEHAGCRLSVVGPRDRRGWAGAAVARIECALVAVKAPGATPIHDHGCTLDPPTTPGADHPSADHPGRHNTAAAENPPSGLTTPRAAAARPWPACRCGAPAWAPPAPAPTPGR